MSPHPATLDDDALLATCTSSLGRTSGPGGQHRNKVATQVVLVHESGIEAHAGERRSVRENRPVAIRRLRLKLATEHREGVPDGEARTALWLERCRDGRIVCNPKHRDYPSLLAEAMDMIWSCGFDVRRAGTRLGCSSSQLVRLLASHPPALERCNVERTSRGRRPLRP